MVVFCLTPKMKIGNMPDAMPSSPNIYK
ncbi:phosphohydrolase, partial [Vibrio anguillarum]|nr:phosphohydrolase [Vibrio anguillarum]